MDGGLLPQSGLCCCEQRVNLFESEILQLGVLLAVAKFEQFLLLVRTGLGSAGGFVLSLPDSDDMLDSFCHRR